MQRAFDLIVALIGLIVFAPLGLVIAVAIKIDSPGPIFFCGERVGRDARPFRLFKFRSMVARAVRQGPGITVAGDHRITKVGRILRATKLDELPQLLNVIKGEMGLVGPRPEDPRYVALYTPQQRRVLSVRPGMTSMASIRYRHEEAILAQGVWSEVYINKVMPDKLGIELDYLARRTFYSDLQVLVRTFVVLFR